MLEGVSAPQYHYVKRVDPVVGVAGPVEVAGTCPLVGGKAFLVDLFYLERIGGSRQDFFEKVDVRRVRCTEVGRPMVQGAETITTPPGRTRGFADVERN